VTTLQVTLSDEQKRRLDRLAERAAVTPEEFLRDRVDQLLDDPTAEFDRVVNRVLEKNAELYRRLA
jgi:predicted transcriptional regulator